MTNDQIIVSRDLLRQMQTLCMEVRQQSNPRMVALAILLWDAISTALEQPAVEPYGHVTVRRLSQRFENHVDQYQFYPAGHVPYTDNVDECIAVYAKTQAQQPAPVQEPAPNPASEWRKLAHQFDAHRMQAIWHLKAMTQDPQAHMAKAVEFLSAPPQAQQPGREAAK